MWRNGYVTLIHCKAAVISRVFDILRHIPGIRRADIHDGTEGTECFLFFFYGCHSFISGGVVVTLAVKLVYTHWIYLVSLSCKNRSRTHRHEAEAPLPRAGFDPFGRKLRQGTFVDLPL